MSVGSVSPDRFTNCIENVVFEDIHMYYPIKGIYVKTNPGVVGDGVIRNITFRDMRIHSPIWFAIYIGPQQEKEPGGAGPGCMLYPILKDCPTQPRVSIHDVKLQNIVIENSRHIAGSVVRCDIRNPCSVHFDNVTVKDVENYYYICENVMMNSIDSTPNITCDFHKIK